MPVSIGAHEFDSIPPHPVSPVTGADVYGSSRFSSNLRLFETNKCYRFAVKREQGIDWSELGGFGWVFPEPNVGGLSVYTDRDQSLELIIDQRTGLIYRFATRNGPAGSGITKGYLDKQGGDYSPGYEIEWALKFREHKGSKEHHLIQHLESHFYLRPQEEENKGASGYDENGFRDAQQITIKAYEDGAVTENARTVNIPNRGDITFDRQMEANRIQLEISGTASELKIVGHDTDYEQRDERAEPDKRIMQERDYQLDFINPILWVSRGGDDITRDKATQREPTGSIFSEVTGPDGYSGSAMMLSSASSLEYEVDTDSYDDFTIMVGLSNIVTTTEILRFANGTGILKLEYSGGVYSIEFTDANGSYSEDLTWSGQGWVMLKISRSEDRMIFSENGVQLGSELLTDIDDDFGGNVTIPAGLKNMYDLRIYSSYIVEEAFLYYYQDITENEGKSTLCL